MSLGSKQKIAILVEQLCRKLATVENPHERIGHAEFCAEELHKLVFGVEHAGLVQLSEERTRRLAALRVREGN